MTRTMRVLALLAAIAIAAPVLAATGSAAVRTAKPSITASGFTFTPGDPEDSFAGEVTAAAVVENPTEKVATGIEVTLAFLDGNGDVIIDSAYRIEYLAPGDEAYAPWTTTYPETKVPKKLTAEITDPGELVTPKQWAEDAQFTLGVGEFGGDAPIPIEDVAVEFADLRYHDSTVETMESGLASSVIGTVRSVSGDELTALEVSCAVFEGGEPVGGGNVFLPIIPAGDEAGIQVPGFKGGLTPDDVRCSARVQYLYAHVGSLDETLVVSDVGFTYRPVLEDFVMGAVLENPTDRWAWGINFSFEVLDESGRVIGSRPGDQPLYLAPGSTTYVQPLLAGTPTEFDGTVTSIRVLVSPGKLLEAGKAIKTEAGFNPASWKFEIDDLAIKDGSIVGTITNRSKRAVNAVDLSCGLFRDGSIVGANVDSLDESDLGEMLEPGAPTDFESGVVLDDLAPDEIRCTATIGQMSDV